MALSLIAMLCLPAAMAASGTVRTPAPPPANGNAARVRVNRVPPVLLTTAVPPPAPAAKSPATRTARTSSPDTTPAHVSPASNSSRYQAPPSARHRLTPAQEAYMILGAVAVITTAIGVTVCATSYMRRA